MNVQAWTFVMVALSFALYIGVALWSKARSTGDFYVAGSNVHPVVNGMATAADWMSAASFIAMAGMISFMGRDGSVYLLGWTGGYVLLALLLAPYLRKFGKYTVPDFVGDRYYSQLARIVAVVCAIFVSFTYVAGQMRGVGIVFSRFLSVNVETGVLIGMGIVFFYAVLGGMKGITYTQVAQYCVLIFAYLVPAIFISILITGNAIPQMGLMGKVTDGSGLYLLDRLNGLNEQLGFNLYIDGNKATIDVFFITAALMLGTAGLPHVIIRFYTVRKASEARISAGWALLFIALLYTTAPAVAIFARTNLLNTVSYEQNGELTDVKYEDAPDWFKNWEATDLIQFADLNGDGAIQYRGPNSDVQNELTIDPDIMVLANPEIAKLPNWIVGLVAAGGLAAALSTAAGLLLVISTAVAHDLLKGAIIPTLQEKQELTAARIAGGCRRLYCWIFRHKSARIRRTSRCLCIRSCGEFVLSCDCDGNLLQAYEQSRGSQWHDCRYHLYSGVYHLFQVCQSRSQHIGALVMGYFTRRYRDPRHGAKLRCLYRCRCCDTIST